MYVTNFLDKHKLNKPAYKWELFVADATTAQTVISLPRAAKYNIDESRINVSPATMIKRRTPTKLTKITLYNSQSC